MVPRIYTDTSVIGGCFDSEFSHSSRRLLRAFISGSALMVISDLTTIELTEAPARVQAILRRVPESCRENIELTKEAVKLAGRYIEAGVLAEGERVDAQHIALATIARVDALVSWNFKHIVNLQRIRGYNSVNLRYGYPILEIRTPAEVISYETE